MNKRNRPARGVRVPKIKTDGITESLELHELNSGIIRVSDAIFDFTYTDISQKIRYLTDKRVKKITFIINSPGGDAYSALAIYDLITGLNRQGIKTVGIVEGLAASAASMIVLQATQERYSKPNARFLIHEARRWAFKVERTSDMKDETQEMMSVTEVIYGILGKRCNKTIREITKAVDRREYWMSAPQAKEFGLIDKIIN